MGRFQSQQAHALKQLCFERCACLLCLMLQSARCSVGRPCAEQSAIHKCLFDECSNSTKAKLQQQLAILQHVLKMSALCAKLEAQEVRLIVMCGADRECRFTVLECLAGGRHKLHASCIR